MRGRPFTTGADYLPLSVNFPSNEKIRIIRSAYKHTGVLFVILLWTNIYKKDFFRKWDGRAKRLFCEEHGFEIDEADKILDLCLEEGIFSKDLYDKYEILTSKRIQTIWLTIITVRRLKVVFIKEYTLISLENAANPKRVVISDLNGNTLTNKVVSKRTTPPSGKNQPKQHELIIPNINDNPDTLTGDELKEYVKVPYEQRSEEFKSIYTEKWYESYIKFSNKIITKYKNLLICKSQIVISDYKDTYQNQKPKEAEIDWALLKLAGGYLKETGNFNLRLIDFIGKYRDDAAQEKSKKIASAPKTGKVLYDPGAGIDTTTRKN